MGDEIALLWSKELAKLERTIAAVQFQKEFLFLQAKPAGSLPVEEKQGWQKTNLHPFSR